jgi:DNA-binding transcriptional ArsR family regulator
LHLLDLAPENVCEAAEAHRLSLKNPAKTVAEHLNTLESQGLVEPLQSYGWRSCDLCLTADLV